MVDMNNLDDMTRQELENLVFCEDVIPCNTPGEMKALQAMTRDELYSAASKWLDDGDECA